MMAVTATPVSLRRCERSNRKGTGETRTVGAMPLGSGSVPFGTSHSNHAPQNSRLHTRVYTHLCVYTTIPRSFATDNRTIHPPTLREFVRSFVRCAPILRKSNATFRSHTRAYTCVYTLLEPARTSIGSCYANVSAPRFRFSFRRRGRRDLKL